ncbi:MAG TPA: hypothetical protein PLC79_01390, partial [Phycisphaerae bacterium]|nr:hypothetical protein [Phycisphaerae bacterium]
NQSAPWFFHALTGGEWLLDVTLRVPANTFTSSELVRLIGLRKLDDRPDLPIYGQWQRVRIHRPNRQWDCIRIQIHDRKEIDTPGMRKVIRTCVRAYLKAVRRLQYPAGALQMREKDRRVWHLSQSSISPDHVKEWQPPTLVELLGRIGRLVPGVQVDWSNRVSLRLKIPDRRLLPIRIGTSHAHGLRVGVPCPAGTVTPVCVDRLGLSPEIVRRHRAFDVVSFWVQRMDQVDPQQFRALIRLWAGEVPPESAQAVAAEDAS